MKLVAAVIFVLTYVGLLAFPKIRAYIALGSACLFVLLGIMPANEVFGAIDWNVLMMIAGTMGIVSLFIESKMPALLADIIIEKTPNVKWAMISLAAFAGLISAFVDNVATLLMVAPISFDISKKLKISPVPGIIAIAVSSNLQGAATLVGDTTAIMLGGHANLNFLDFFLFQSKPGMFWVVQAGMIASLLILLYLFRKDTQTVSIKGETKVHDYFPTVLLVGMVALLILASFIPSKPAVTNGLICLSLFAVGVVRKSVQKRDWRVIIEAGGEIDYFTLLLLAGIFVMVGGITEAGLIDDLSRVFVKIGQGDLFVVYTLIVWASVFFSAFIDNIPYVATMLPVVKGIAVALGVEPYLLYFGLLSGATLGGNLTPVGASANIAAIGILRKDGHEVSTKEFMKIGVPFTLAAVTVAYVILWFLWG
ncbi:MAG: TRAP transporter large permease subunit [Firmicutes bacterium]|jgi:Na+/H+ antiporter NhaD/arsenite permease-like protein|nr:TRAP transporter large permease subunit [Bacillota bacterium]